MILSSRIVGVGSYLPDRILTNCDLEKVVDTTDEWITGRTGIKARHIAAVGEYTSDLATKALLAALANAGKGVDWLDGVIVATVTPDKIMPSTAAIVQNKAKLPCGLALDINVVCSGFIYALTVADSLIKTGVAKRIAVIGAETMSRILDWTDRSTCVLFGDGAGAVILEASTEPLLWYSNITSDGALNDILDVPGGVSMGNMHEAKLVMNGREVFRHAVDKMCTSSMAVLAKASMLPADVDLIIPHQANARIISMVAARLGIPEEKAVVTIQNQGNTSAATIPLAMDDAIKQKRLCSGMKILLTAAGAGFSWGSILMQY